MARYAPVDPKQSFPALEEGVLERWREGETFRRQLESRARAAALELLRGPADRQRQAGLPPRPRPRLQGHLPALQVDVRLRRAPQGRLGLPRPPGRARDREGARDQLEGGDRGVRDRRVQPALPRVGVRLRRRLEPDGRADRPLDRPRRPLRDDGRPTTSSRSGGRCSRTGTTTASTRATRSFPTARAAAPP